MTYIEKKTKDESAAIASPITFYLLLFLFLQSKEILMYHSETIVVLCFLLFLVSFFFLFKTDGIDILKSSFLKIFQNMKFYFFSKNYESVLSKSYSFENTTSYFEVNDIINIFINLYYYIKYRLRINITPFLRSYIKKKINSLLYSEMYALQELIKYYNKVIYQFINTSFNIIANSKTLQFFVETVYKLTSKQSQSTKKFTLMKFKTFEFLI